MSTTPTNAEEDVEAAVPLIEQKPPPSATAVAPPSIAAELNTAGFIGGLIIALVATASAGTGVFLVRGSEGFFVFCSTYLMEFSLSMDNMFAFYLIFKFYKCPEECQSVCLWFGIAGAVLLRALMMLLGTAVMLTAKPLMLVFAGLLLYSSFGMLKMIATGEEDDDDEDLSSNSVVRVVRWLNVPVTKDYFGKQFFSRDEGSGKLIATPLLLVLVTIELSDIVFAVDSIPAVLGLSNDITVAYVAVMCAILGLRTIYTLSVVLIKSFRFLQHAVALLLAFVGVKIVLDVCFGFTVSIRFSLLAIVCTLGSGILASVAKVQWERRGSNGSKETELME